MLNLPRISNTFWAKQCDLKVSTLDMKHCEAQDIPPELIHTAKIRDFPYIQGLVSQYLVTASRKA